MSDLLGLAEEKPESLSAPEPDPEWAAHAKSGANWFYWIAGLSLINSAAFVMGANFHFLAGLGLTELVDAVVAASIEQGAPTSMKAVSVVFDGIVFIAFALVGYFANKFFQTAFIIGIIAYVIDALIVLVIGDYLMAGFHAFALFFIVKGFIACRQLRAFEAANPKLSQPPPLAESYPPPGV